MWPFGPLVLLDLSHMLMDNDLYNSCIHLWARRSKVTLDENAQSVISLLLSLDLSQMCLVGSTCT